MHIHKTLFIFITVMVTASTFCSRPEHQDEKGPCVPAEIPEHAPKLQKIDMKVGDGREAKDGDAVVVHYLGTLDTGQVFDDSRKSNKPLGFNIGQKELIKGWSLGITGMREGGTRKLIIPPHLAYGRCGLGNIISANATIQFDIELIEIRDKPFERPGPVHLEK